MRAADSPGVQLRGETSLVLMGGFSHTCWEMVHYPLELHLSPSLRSRGGQRAGISGPSSPPVRGKAGLDPADLYGE